MGAYDNPGQYFDSPNVSSGYSGMDDSGGDYWSGFELNNDNYPDSFNDPSWDSSQELRNSDFWDFSNNWDNSYDQVFNVPNDWSLDNSGIGDTGDDDSIFGGLGGLLGKAGSFLTSTPGLMMIAGGLNAYGKKSDQKALERQKELDRKHLEKMQKEKLAAELEIAKMRAGGGGGPDKPQPGRAERTTTTIGNHPVDWSRK